MSKATKTTKATPAKKTASSAPKLKKGASIRFRAFRGGEGDGTYVATENFSNGAYHTLKVEGNPYKIRTGQILSIDGVAFTG